MLGSGNRNVKNFPKFFIFNNHIELRWLISIYLLEAHE